MCGCQLSLYGNIGLRPKGDRTPAEASLAASESESLVVFPQSDQVQSLEIEDSDWTTFRASPDRSDTSKATLPPQVSLSWSKELVADELPTAPVAAGGLIFVADRTGAIRALSTDGKEVWKAFTCGAIFYPPAIAHDRLFVGSADGRVYAFEAATGRPLWTFRVAPEERWIPLFGRLVSRWPIAGGVVVNGERVYAAAGITHYDGTYVVALDARTGKRVARNDTSGRLSDVVNSGVSMQGELSIVEGELRFPGGGIYEMARYDLESLECLNEARHLLSSEYRTAFYPWYPGYDKYVSIERAMPDGNILCHDVSYDGTAFSKLMLETPRPLGAKAKMKKDLAGEFLRRRGKEPPPTHVWSDQQNRRFTSFAICGKTLITTGHTDKEPDKPFLSAIRLADGVELWKHDLPASAVKGGTAIDREGNIHVTLENGQLLSFQATDRN